MSLASAAFPAALSPIVLPWTSRLETAMKTSMPAPVPIAVLCPEMTLPAPAAVPPIVDAVAVDVDADALRRAGRDRVAVASGPITLPCTTAGAGDEHAVGARCR